MSARTGPCGGCRATGIPTATPDHQEIYPSYFDVAHSPPECHFRAKSSPPGRPERVSRPRTAARDAESALQSTGCTPIFVDNSNVFCKIEMLTPKGEHSFPCSTRVMFDGRISFDGIATVKTL